MTQEDKDLLLKDLVARLPYGVKVEYQNDTIIETRELGLGSLHDFMYNNVIIKPYLRPMSSMTEEEKKEYDKLFSIRSQGETYCENWDNALDSADIFC